MAFRAARVGSSGYRLPVSAFSVLTYQHLRILSINCQKVFATVGAFLVCIAAFAAEKREKREQESKQKALDEIDADIEKIFGGGDHE